MPTPPSRVDEDIVRQENHDLIVLGAMFLVLLVLAMAGLVWTMHNKHACEAKGGVFLWREGTCIKAQVIH